MNDERKSTPDELLKQLQEEEHSKTRGKLKIYLGMAAGVGKTFAMLSDALVEKARGVDIVLGYLEYHGRKETEDLGEKFETLPLKAFPYNNVTLKDFDLHAALHRKPAIVIVDELAHTNAPGATHLKRWQDVEALLESGISVHTTLNIQHLESLNDVIGRVTGVTVKETVPDRVLATADALEVVDLPPEELIQRLKEGKVYAAEKVPHALENFFKQGNLIALRELVLRTTAERIDAQMVRYHTQHRIGVPWPTPNRVMVCVAPNALSSSVVRAARRIALSLHAELIALSIEGPQYAHLSESSRQHATEALELAVALGADKIVRYANDIARETVAVAIERNVSLIVVGKPRRRSSKDLIRGSFVDRLLRHGSGLEIYVVPGDDGEEGQRITPAFSKGNGSLSGLLAVCLVTGASTGVSLLMYPFFELSNLIMVYLLGVTFIAARYSWIESFAASLSAVLAFDYFFVPPRFTFAVSDAQYLVTFLVMLIISLLISTLTLRIRAQVRAVNEREQRSAALFDFGKRLLTVENEERLIAIAREQIHELFDRPILFFLPEASGKTIALHDSFPSTRAISPEESAVAQWCFDHRVSSGAGTDTLPGAKGLYLPLCAGDETLGVLGLLLDGTLLDIGQKTFFETVANQIALSLMRLRTERESQDARLHVEREQLRNALLSSISHDLRTPLASIAGAASGLYEQPGISEANRKELARTIVEEAERLSRIIRNVLDMIKLESSGMPLQTEWHSLEELVASSISRTELALKGRETVVSLPENLPLVKVDGLLVEQVFVNLLENIARYTPVNSSVNIIGQKDEGTIIVDVSDRGPGIPPGEEEKIFEKLYQGPGAHEKGVGLGLTICRAVMKAHGGSITARNRSGGGASFRLEFPLVTPQPEVPHE